MIGKPFTIFSFQEFLKEHRLMASKCKKCDSLWLPPRPICSKCHSDQLEWVELSGDGKLITFTVIAFGTKPMLNAGYNRDNPYCTGIVEVEEGPRISAEILGVDVLHPENIKIGTLVKVEFVDRESWHFVRELAEIKKIYAAFRAHY
jgi:uncharacterized OB-fold protein